VEYDDIPGPSLVQDCLGADLMRPFLVSRHADDSMGRARI